ncbi:VOC family protein [Paenibacillus piri]|uniref:VOC family protein n=1 Tax=Paenibacillus piri TaxID=2547395 RepID=A0A4R5KKG3_9BACL|nr:VOC family protein [Paenibacillus piri]TDF95956.1 VOC family protein [Paenibacillus piri]
METRANPIPLQNRIASIFVHVSDLRRAAAWYSELLGLPLQENQLNGGPVYFFPLPGTGLVLDNNANNRKNPDWREDMQPLVMLAADDIDSAYEYVKSKAEPLFEPERHPGMAYFNFRAPDGRAYMACWSEGGGQDSAPPESASPIRPRIGGVFINVREMKAAADWISDLLGVALPDDAADSSICIVPTSRGAHLLLDDNRARRGETFEIPFMFDSNDIDAAYSYAADRGMTIFHGIERLNTVAYFTLADPDGNLVMVCQES